MPTWAIVLIIVAAVVVAAFIALYFFGKRIQKRQDEQQEAIEAASQNMTLFIIDKKKMRAKNSGLPKVVQDQMPRRFRLAKLPCVKVKVGPRVMTMLADNDVFKQLLPKQEVKATVSGIYITSAKRIRGPVPEAPKKKRFKLF
ncbi:MAG: hypothetical protein K6B15_06245 [Parasporobacterium sp.]|nr:hypothetical protein [Parasporobacterium sp.]